MRTLIMITLGTAVLLGCTVKETVVEPASPAVVYQPAPTVVYQSPPTVVIRHVGTDEDGAAETVGAAPPTGGTVIMKTLRFARRAG